VALPLKGGENAKNTAVRDIRGSRTCVG